MTYVVVSLSGGKDSTAMLLRMLELGEHIDEVITCDTGMEFPAMYRHLDRLHQIITDAGIKHTILKNPESFEYIMLEKEVKSEKYGDHYGYGFPSMNARWCTRHLKLDMIKNHLREVKKQHEDTIQCIGLASDETKRLERDNNKNNNHRHPLVEWGWTEKKCLQYCYNLGFDWEGLYELFDRVSCWCCPLAKLSELKKLWWNFPELWHKLEEWEIILSKPDHGKRGAYRFRNDISVFELTARFSMEMKREYLGMSNKKLSKEVKTFIRDLPEQQKTLIDVGDW